jgi:hypothetical protein
MRFFRASLPTASAIASAACLFHTAAVGATCTPITNVAQLQAMNNNLAGNYCLANDIDASTKANFNPIGDLTAPFTGTFEGNGFVIRNLTIKSSKRAVGLFSTALNAKITNFTLANVTVKATPNFASASAAAVVGGIVANDPEGALVGSVHVSGGQVSCLTANCDAGGLFGGASNALIRNSSTSAAVVGSRFVGGAGGLAGESTVQRTYATGSVRCTSTNCMAGGLMARAFASKVISTFATGPVTVDGTNFDSRGGGLIGLIETTTTVTRSYATGSVTGVAGFIGGLIGQHNANVIDQTYATGVVTGNGATTGGLCANLGPGTITNSYWDTETSGQATSHGGTAMTTAQLRADLPTGFADVWAINQTLSYPYLTLPQINFVSPLATLVRSSKVFTFLPIGQRDDWEFIKPPRHPDLASLATVYTMIGRAIGETRNVTPLKDVAVDKYFWDETAEVAVWSGPVKTYATLGPLTAIGAADPIEVANVIGHMQGQQLVILRGKYKKGGSKVTHWMLGTLYTENASGDPTALVAHDPLTGLQVTIDLVTKKVVTPADFPRGSFTVDAFRSVTVN